jgi:hypothetical protein
MGEEEEEEMCNGILRSHPKQQQEQLRFGWVF